jgi:hypothetical protein
LIEVIMGDLGLHGLINMPIQLEVC